MTLVTKSLTVALGLSLCGISGYLVYLLLKKEDEDDDSCDKGDSDNKIQIVHVNIPKDMVKMLIGRAGKNIRQIEQKSNTRINFRERDDSAVCMIKGNADGCHVAENLVQLFITKQPLVVCEDIVVPQNAIGRIIGRDGDRIREISMMSNAKINVDSDRASLTRRITIKGTSEQIVIAKSLIREVVEEVAKQQERLEASLAKREPRLPQKRGDSPKSVSPSVERISPVPGQPDAQFEVYVSAMVDPSRFWLQIVGPKAAQLDVLVDEMTDYYKKEENRDSHLLQTINKGDLVAAVFQYDSKWYRAEVLKVTSADNREQAELYYVDYGDTDTVPVEEVFELRTDFLQLHFQAIECFLARVAPVGENWSTEAVDKFEEWTHVAQWQKLSAKINGYQVREKTRAKREGSPVPGVDLFDVSNDQDVDIARELVNHGYAVFKNDAELRS